MISESDTADDAFACVRHAMVQHQLAARGMTDRRVLEAMERIPRHEFVAPSQQGEAYDDGPLPIGHGQTISQPFTVAFMVEALQLRGDERVLEIGTGSGYAAAILSQLANRVHSIERIPELAEEARHRLERLGIDNVEIHVGDGTLGLPSAAPFDGIIAAASSETLPAPYLQQLADGGRIVLPLGHSAYGQRMNRITRQGEHVQREDLGGFAFVPMIGKHGWPE